MSYGAEHDRFLELADAMRVVPPGAPMDDVARARLVRDIVALDGMDDPAQLTAKHPAFLRQLASGAYARAAARAANAILDRKAGAQ